MTKSRRFLVRFAVVIVLAYAVIAVRPVNDGVIVPYTRFLATGVASVLRVCGISASAHDTVILVPTFAIDIHNGCNGIEAAVLLLAAMVAFPAPPLTRMRGLILGLLFIQAINILRLGMLFWLGLRHRSLFDLFHVAVWQTLIILATLVFFYLWTSRLAPAKSSA